MKRRTPSEHPNDEMLLAYLDAGKILDARFMFRHGYIVGGANEGRKLLVGYIRFIHPEAIYINTMDRSCIRGGIVPVFESRARILSSHENSPPGT